MSSKLDDILDELYHKSYDVAIINPDFYASKAKQQIKSLILELIGDDDEVPYDEGSKFYFEIIARNKERAQLRQKVEEL